MANEKKKRNLINILYITIFASSLALLGFVTADIVYNYIKQQNLIKQLTEDFHLGSLGEDAQEGYFIVYAANDYIIETDDGEVIIIYEMK